MIFNRDSSKSFTAQLFDQKTKNHFAGDAEGKQVFIVCIYSQTANKPENAPNGEGIDVYMSTLELAEFLNQSCVSRFTAMQVWRSLATDEFDILSKLPH